MSVAENPGATPQPGAGSNAANGRKRGVVIGAVALSLVAVGGVAALAGQGFLGSGADQDGQPSAVLPVDSLAYYRLDFDPSTSQKVAAFRLFDKLPEAKQALGDSNPKKALFELIAKNNDELKDIDYTNDIEPWLGDRMGLAILAPREGGTEPVVAAAVQVTDEAKANEGIAKLKEKSGVDIGELTDRARSSAPIGPNPLAPGMSRGYADYSSDGSPSASASDLQVKPVVDADPTDAPTPGVSPTTSGTTPGATPGTASDKEAVHWYRDGYMVFTQKADEQAVRAAIDKGRLSDNPDFTKDMNDLGEQGVLSTWSDTPKFMDALFTGQQQLQSMRGLFELYGRQASAVRFDPGFVEVASLSRDNGLNVTHQPVKDVNALPADTVGFVSTTGGADLLKALWPRIEKIADESSTDWRKQLAEVERQLGVSIPGDVETLLGKQFDLVVSEKSVKDKLPVLGLRLITDTTKAQGILDKLNTLWKQSGGDAANTFGLNQKTAGDVLYVGSTASYADELAAGGSLGDDATLKEAVKDLDKQHSVLYVNLDKIEHLYLEGMPSGQERDAVASLKAVGAGTVKNGDRYDSTLRILVN